MRKYLVVFSAALALEFVLAAASYADGASAADFDQLIASARAALENWKIAEARGLLDEAEKARPGTLLVAYYRAYCDYREGNYGKAAEGFKSALRIDRNDGWSEYMMALSIAKAGRTREARKVLESIKEKYSGGEIGQTAAKTIDEIDALEKSASNRFAAVAETGAMLDTNPAFRADSSGEGKTDAGATISARGEFALLRDRKQRLVLGAGAGETAYVLRYEPADWTTVSSWLGYRRSGEPWAVLSSYRFDFAWYGYDPFTSVHTLSSGLRISEAPWTMTVADLDLYARVPYDADFDYLAARGAALSLWQEFSRATGLRGRAGYTFRFEKADPAEFHQEDTATDDAGTLHLLTGDYRTDYSFFGHGPAASGHVPLGAGFSLEASADFNWRTFFHPDRVVYADGGVVTALWEKERNDLRIYADAAVKWAFADRLALIFRAAYLKNISTLGETGDDPIDRNYSRFLTGIFLRAALNPDDL